MEINTDFIRYENRVYPVRNISSAAMLERTVERKMDDISYKKRRKTLVSLSAIPLLIGATIYPVLNVIDYNLWYSLFVYPGKMFSRFDIILVILGFIMCVFAFRRPLVWVREYGVELQTNAGSVSLIWSRDRGFIEQLKEIIFKAISSQSGGVQYTVNIDNREFQDLSQNTFNTTNNVTFDYSVNFTEHKGVSPEQMAFLSGTFNDAMRELAKGLSKEGADATLAELKALREEIAKPTPDKSILRRTYDRLKTTCDAHGTVTNATGLLGTIWSGISIFF